MPPAVQEKEPDSGALQGALLRDWGTVEFATRSIDPASRGFGRTKDAWTAFWQEPGQSHCVAGASQVWQRLSRHWSSFAASLGSRTRVLDLGCGAGAVASLVLEAREDVDVTGIDFARIPLTLHSRVELLSDTAMESLPFDEGSFGAAVSQFGFEYSQLDLAVREMARVLAPDASISLLVHHADSSIVAANRARLDALVAVLSPAMCTGFCSGDAAAFHAQMSALVARHPHDSLVAQLSKCLPARVSRAPRERVAIWKAIEEAVSPERCLAESLNSCCVCPEELNDWLVPLRASFELQPVSVLREPNGGAIAWKIEGKPRLADS
jgi:ubiquinone/menaquinone biosynthesis C-methylase UbiE